MNIKFENIVPLPLENKLSGEGSIWNNSVNFSEKNNYHICAPSGSGKSTLINVIYGLRSDFKGRLIFENNEYEGDWAAIRQNDLAVIFQDLKLVLDLTALENIQLKNQLTNHFTEEQIDKYATMLRIGTLLDKPVAYLSRGERQRVAILRALAMPFKTLLLDEPFSHLDEKTTEFAIALINNRCEQEGANIILANLSKDDYFKYDSYLKL